MKKPADRHQWILQHMLKKQAVYGWGRIPYSVDILDEHFVDDFIENTGAKFRPMIFGADKCKSLARDLADLYKRGVLVRHSCGINSPTAGGGWPKWVYIYSLNFQAKAAVESLAGMTFEQARERIGA